MLKITQGNHLEGCLGHTTVHFSRPIIEGRYYLELKIVKPSINESKSKIKYAPSLRLGICCYGYPKTISLGQGLSVGYKSATGEFVCSSCTEKGGEPLE